MGSCLIHTTWDVVQNLARESGAPGVCSNADNEKQGHFGLPLGDLELESSPGTEV